VKNRLEKERKKEGWMGEGEAREKGSKDVIILLLFTWTLRFTLPMHF
jgi:hypothetical protein